MKNRRGKILLASSLLATLAIVVACWWQLKGGPPRKIVFAAGSRDGAYYQLAQRYKEKLAQSGLEVEVLESKGSIDNLRLLEDGQADIAFVQSGLKGRDQGHLRSLGAVFYEPVWVFVRGPAPTNEFRGLQGKRIAVGEQGSGTLEVARTLLADNKLTNQVKMLTIGGDQAKQRLLAGEIDAMFVVGSPSTALIKELTNRKGISLVSLVRAKAYSRYHDSLTDVTLYRGMMNLEQDIPKQDQLLVATAANLVVSDRFHYALVTLVLQTAKSIHGAPGPFHAFGDFPSARPNTFPLVAEAQSFYSKGPSFFYRNLPFYVAANFDRLIFVLLPLLTLLIPLSRMLPPLLDWWGSRGLNKMQSQIAELELNRRQITKAEALEQLKTIHDDLWELKRLPPDKQNDVFLLQLRYERLCHDLAGHEDDQREGRRLTPLPDTKIAR